jgi:hypothetical protein
MTTEDLEAELEGRKQGFIPGGTILEGVSLVIINN